MGDAAREVEVSEPDLDNDVFIVCSCEKTCRKDGHPLLRTLGGAGARCSVWVAPSHLAVVARRVVAAGHSLAVRSRSFSETLAALRAKRLATREEAR